MKQKETCFHCGQPIEKERLLLEDKLFCCNGCLSVFQILNANNLTNFYQLNDRAGVRPNEDNLSQFDYLDTKEIFDKIVDFSEGTTSLVTFKIPVIHCSSCIWLLESLQNLDKNIHYSQVNFTRKTLQISFNQHDLPLSALAKFLTNLGYKPVISLESADLKTESQDRTLIVKLAIAGFAFGNGMFLTFPEYIGGGDLWMEHYKGLFRALMIGLSLPVVLYSASDYYTSAWYGLKNKMINIDVPIVLGILVLFGRSLYEVVTDYGSGYFDTLCGLLFFMLLGKFFQKRTYNTLSYDRDYKSFYPIAVTRLLTGGVLENVLLSEIKVGDRILVRNQEIIPVDAVLIAGDGNIDNGFITGESATISKVPGNKIYAGGKQIGSSLELEVIKNVDQSYLTQLWNKEAFKKQENGLDTLVNSISQYFTFVILGIALFAGFYWYLVDLNKMFQVISAILIIACPCALALSSPFTFGHIMRILGRNKFYVKDTQTIEKLAKLDALVFDKTGTITHRKKSNIHFDGKEWSQFDEENVKTLLKNSNHPLSKALYDFISVPDLHYPLEDFSEISSKGYSAKIRGVVYKIGSAGFVGASSLALQTAVFVSRNDEVLGKFIFKNEYRSQLSHLFSRLKDFKVYILSGDNESEASVLKKIIPSCTDMAFNQSPEDKLEYIRKIQAAGSRVAMIGDGLNDAGALKQSNVGIAIADDSNSFTPSSDVIMAGEKVASLDRYISLCKGSIIIVKCMFLISFIYNIVGLSFAVTGNMDPLFAAIIMPISSITVILFTTISTWFLGRKYFGKED